MIRPRSKTKFRNLSWNLHLNGVKTYLEEEELGEGATKGFIGIALPESEHKPQKMMRLRKRDWGRNED